MDIKEIKEKLDRARADRDKQQEKVDKLNETMNQLREKITKENAKLGQLNDKVDKQEFYILKQRLLQYGITGDAGIDDLLTIYEQYGNSREDEPTDADMHTTE